MRIVFFLASLNLMGGYLRYEVRINSRGIAESLCLSPATFVKRYPFDIALHATRLSKRIASLWA